MLEIVTFSRLIGLAIAAVMACTACKRREVPPYRSEAIHGPLMLQPGRTPFDLGLGTQTSGPPTDVTIQGRPFVLLPLTGSIAGRPAYALQVNGDGLSMSFACYTSSGSYSVTGDSIRICDESIVFTQEPRKYFVDGHPFALAAPGVYSVFKNGTYYKSR